VLTLTALGVVICGLLWSIDDPLKARAAAVAALYVTLALTEIVPPFVPTLALLVASPLVLGSFGTRYQFPAVLLWPADPVMALFAGGLSLGLAARRHGLDQSIAGVIVRLASGSQRALVAWVLVGTATLSMWMSNIAAAAMVIVALRPVVAHPAVGVKFRSALLLAVAMGGNLGGIATPIGTGPNGIAIAAVEETTRITFVQWMTFGVPIAFVMLAVTFGLLVVRYGVAGRIEGLTPKRIPLQRSSVWTLGVFALVILAWLSEPIHRVPASLVSLGAAFVLFASNLLTKEDLGSLDWSTLGLVAGGIALGKLLEHSGLLTSVASLEWNALPRLVWLGGLIAASAVLAALMSNTGTAALLVPLGLGISAEPSTGVLIAIGASFGMVFIISTPQNAMAYGEGGLRSADFLWVGGLVMALGCVLMTLVGPQMLALFGVP
jgi:solute carrier family 13 (sodium-dependent dicarboxylate transporter), member 2/3/5